eukprot:6206996-Pyramimonas_sp.AAC.1
MVARSLLTPFRRGTVAEQKEKGKAEDAVIDNPEEEEDNDDAIAFNPRKVTIVKDEKSVRDRKSLTRGAASVKQTMTMAVVSTTTLPLPERQSLHYAGTNRGTVIGPIKLRNLSEEWSATVGVKKELYGRKFRIPVGGKGADGNVPRTDDTVEPVCWNAMPQEFFEELIHRYFIANVVDLTPGDFSFGEVCMDKRVNYAAVAWTVEHRQAGRDKLQMAAMKTMTTMDHPHFNKQFSEALKGTAAAAAGTAGEDE